MTEQEVTNSISAAFDSVNLINQLDLLTPPLSDEDESTRARNVEHLRVMMAIEDFVNGLTTEQEEQINLLIV